MKRSGIAKNVLSHEILIDDGLGHCRRIYCGHDHGCDHGGCHVTGTEIRWGLCPPHLVGSCCCRGVLVKGNVNHVGSCRGCHVRIVGPPDRATPRVEESVGSPRVAEIGGGCPCWGSGVD